MHEAQRKTISTMTERQLNQVYKKLVARAAVDLKLALDYALSTRLPYQRLARLKRARREMQDELHDLEKGIENGN